MCTLAWTVVLVVAGLLLSDHATRGESTAVNLGLCGVLIYPVTAFLAARSPSRWGWGAYLTISLVFAWVFGASVFFGTDVGS